MRTLRSSCCAKIGRKLLLATAVLAAASVTPGQDFYETRLRAGEAALDAGRPADAAEDLRIAAFGYLERPALLCEALAHLALAEQSAGRAAGADAALARLVEIGRAFPACGEARLEAPRRAEFEALARRKLPRLIAEQLLVAPKRATAAPPAATPTPPPTVVPTARPGVPAAPPRPTLAPPAVTPAPARVAATAKTGTNDLDRQPQLKATTPAVYPPSARRAGIGGVVLLSVLVSEKGEPLRVEVARSVQPDLDQAAVAAVRKWLFEPGRKRGAAVAAWMTVAVPFDASRR
ncbi:MAG: energy transducer TonB [Thermoanaerobaculia bacterium]